MADNISAFDTVTFVEHGGPLVRLVDKFGTPVAVRDGLGTRVTPIDGLGERIVVRSGQVPAWARRYLPMGGPYGVGSFED